MSEFENILLNGTLYTLGGGSGLTADIKNALLQIARKVAYIDEHGQDYYDDLYDALYEVTGLTLDVTSISLGTIGATSQITATTVPSGAAVTWASSDTSVATVNNGLVTAVGYGSATITASAGNLTAQCSVVIAQATVTSISAVYTPSGTIYETNIPALDTLKSDLVVTAHWSNGTTSTVTDYALSGTLSAGSNTITVSYGGQTTTITVTVVALSSISAVYTQSGTVYDTASLDDLKADLVVTATFADSTTQTVTGYTLSGTLAEGTSTITVSYSGQITTFTVTVTHYEPVTVAITWTGTGGEKTSSVIDATQLSVYFNLPFEEESPYLVDGATADAGGFKIKDALLYDDPEATTVVGYYQWDNQTVSETDRTTGNTPVYDLGITILAAPSGYYVKLRCTREGSTMFASNGNVTNYLNTYGTSVIMQ